MQHQNVLKRAMPMNRDTSRLARLALVRDLPGSALDRWEDEGGHLRADSRSGAGTAPAIARMGEAFPYRWARRSPLMFLMPVLTGVAA